MNEVTKLYENAGIKPTHYDACKIEDAYWLNEELANEYGTFDNYMKLNCIYHYQECTDECRHAYDRDTYPPFTAEKQLELIKLLAKFENVLITYYHSDERYNINYRVSGWYDGSFSGYVEEAGNIFEEVLASVCNHLWQDLTDTERKQIKEILSE